MDAGRRRSAIPPSARQRKLAAIAGTSVMYEVAYAR